MARRSSSPERVSRNKVLLCGMQTESLSSFSHYYRKHLLINTVLKLIKLMILLWFFFVFSSHRLTFHYSVDMTRSAKYVHRSLFINNPENSFCLRVFEFNFERVCGESAADQQFFFAHYKSAFVRLKGILNKRYKLKTKC